MEVKRSRVEWLRRYISFVFILFVIALGTSLSIRANLGSSPISAPPYILSLIPGMSLTMGQLTICMHVFFIAVQILLLRKNFEKRQFLQIAVSFLFGFYTDLTMWMTGFLQIPFTMNPTIGYPLRFMELLAGGAILAFGIACEVRCDSLMLAGEGFPLAIAKFLKKEFSKVKICTDTFLVSTGVVFMLIFFGRWDWKMVGAGTLVSMFYVGFMVRVFSPRIGWLDRIFIPAAERRKENGAERAASNSWPGHTVITIARMYGSGIPLSMNPSKEDAIYVSESRTIRELAHHGPCVIIGRLGNWILRDNPNILRVFVTSGKEYAARQVAGLLHIPEEEAARKIERINTGRANHYWQYTGRQWTDVGEYDLILNTEKLGIDGAADMILRAVKDMR